MSNLQCHRKLHSLRACTSPSLRCHGRQAHARSSPCRLPNAPHTFSQHASSAATALTTLTPPFKTTPPAQNPTTLPVPRSREKLNPPPGTYAPPLSIPARRADQSYFGYLFRAGRAYITFYKTGISNVRSTARLAKTLRAKAAASPQKESILTRAEWQVVKRSRADMLRLPGFGILVLILGEWLPLIALYITPLIPEACRIPTQVERSLRKLEDRRKERERRFAEDAARLVARDRQPGMSPSTAHAVNPRVIRLEQLDKLHLYSLLLLSTRFDAHSWVWDRLFLTPPKAVLTWGLKRRLRYLRMDDGLIERDGGALALEGKEVERCCVERGIPVLERKAGALRRDLELWFKR